MKVNEIAFPVGYHQFHKDQVFNFQLNRWHSLGYARFEDMEEAGKRIDTFDDWKEVMLALAEKALSEERFLNAAFYYRAAEFYTFSDDPDKESLYDRFIDLFYRVFAGDGIEKFEVPYGKTFLPVMKIPYTGSINKGTIVMHGGFDSFIQEFYSMMGYFSGYGYDVIAFEGPGQGAARIKNGLPIDYEWEKPARSILDHFNLGEVTWLGISMGGWFCFRAAAFEPRIKRVIASSIAYDYMKTMNVVLRKMHIYFIKHFRNYSNKMVLKGIKKEKGIQAWMSAQLMYITKKNMPMDAFDVWLQMNEENLHSELVKQDVLILTGRNDHFIPFRAHDMQVKALTNAKSVTARVFTEETYAHNHCQIGNIKLALEVILKWIPDVSP